MPCNDDPVIIAALILSNTAQNVVDFPLDPANLVLKNMYGNAKSLNIFGWDVRDINLFNESIETALQLTSDKALVKSLLHLFSLFVNWQMATEE